MSVYCDPCNSCTRCRFKVTPPDSREMGIHHYRVFFPHSFKKMDMFLFAYRLSNVKHSKTRLCLQKGDQMYGNLLS
jgi:hypothetical protein